MKRLILNCIWAFISGLKCVEAQAGEADYSGAITQLESAVRAEMKEWGIEGISLALTDGTRLVHAAGFGEAQPESVFRAGSISKLFNAIAVMQLVEAGRLDLDAPLSAHPQAVLPVNPFRDAPAVTLRQLLSHRSGLQRESPVGSYFDAAEPSLRAMCESVRDCVLATPPGAKTRYSNLAPSLAGHLVAMVEGIPFEQYQQDRILAPLGMTRSAWRRRDVPEGRLIRAHMRFADPDGRGGFHRGDAPVFDLGTVPAGNLFTTAPDLAQFLIMLAKCTRGETAVLRPATLKGMWEPQFDASGGFGLAFAVGKFRSHRTVGHSGSVYGHSTLLTFLPELQLGVVILANEDIVSGRVARLGNLALSLMLEAKTGERAADIAPDKPAALDPADLAQLAGTYESQSFWAELKVEKGTLMGSYSSQPCRFTPQGKGRFLLNSLLHHDALVVFETGPTGKGIGFMVAPQKFVRVPERTEILPEKWRGYCGVYGPEFIPIIVHERFGHLYATTENMVDYRLTPVNRHVFALPLGMYTDEFVVFQFGAEARPAWIDFASVRMERRSTL